MRVSVQGCDIQAAGRRSVRGAGAWDGQSLVEKPITFTSTPSVALHEIDTCCGWAGYFGKGGMSEQGLEQGI